MQKTAQSFYIIRFSDCDPFGHLNNSGYINYMLNAREDHLRDDYRFNLEAVYSQGRGWVVSSHQIQYLRPAKYNEKVCIQSSLIEASESHLLVEIAMWDEMAQTCKAILWTKFTHINLKTGRKENHNEEFAQFAAYILNNEIKTTDGFENRVVSILGILKSV